MVGAGINMMGVVPIIGDAGVKLSKGARSALRDQGFTEGFFHASKQDIQDGFKAGYNDGMVFVTPEREFANNWVGKGKYQQRLGEADPYDMHKADRQKIWDEYESKYGSYENWPTEIEDEYVARSADLTRQYAASGGAIYPVAVKANNQFDPEENPEIIAEFLRAQGRDPNATTIVSGKTDLEAYQEGNYLFYENKEMADFLKDKGYDSVWLREDTTQSGLSKPFSTLAVLDETGVKPVYDFAREADTAASALRGLNMDQGARMQRAQDLGFDTSRPLYHATNSSFDAFEVPEGGFLKYGKGVYTTPKPEYSDRYIRENRNLDSAYKEGANVIPVYARGKIATEQDWEAARQEMLSEGINPAGYNPMQEEIKRRLQEKGFDGLNMFGSEVIIYDPKNIRSINAEFDPAKADSADLLSSVGTASALRGVA